MQDDDTNLDGVHSCLSAGLVLKAEVGDKELQVMLQPLGPQRVVQSELQHHARALLPH